MVPSYKSVDEKNFKSIVRNLYECYALNNESDNIKEDIVLPTKLNNYWNELGINLPNTSVLPLEYGIICSFRDIITISNGLCVYALKNVSDNKVSDMMANLSRFMMVPLLSGRHNYNDVWEKILIQTPWKDITKVYAILSYLCVTNTDNLTLQLKEKLKSNMISMLIDWCERLFKHQQYIQSQHSILTTNVCDSLHFTSNQLMAIIWDIYMFSSFCDGFLSTLPSKNQLLNFNLCETHGECHYFKVLSKFKVVPINDEQWNSIMNAILPLLNDSFLESFECCEIYYSIDGTKSNIFPTTLTHMLVYSFSQCINNLLNSNENCFSHLTMEVIQKIYATINYITRWCFDHYKLTSKPVSFHAVNYFYKQHEHILINCTNIYCRLRKSYYVAIDDSYVSMIVDMLVNNIYTSNRNISECDCDSITSHAVPSQEILTNFKINKIKSNANDQVFFGYITLASLESTVLKQLTIIQNIIPTSTCSLLVNMMKQLIDTPSNMMIHFYSHSYPSRKNFPPNSMFYHMCRNSTALSDSNISNLIQPSQLLLSPSIITSTEHHYELFLKNCSTLYLTMLNLVKTLNEQSNVDLIYELIEHLIQNISSHNNILACGNFSEEFNYAASDLKLYLSLHTLGFITQGLKSNSECIEKILKFFLQIVSVSCSQFESYVAYQLALVLLYIEEDYVYDKFIEFVSNVMDEIFNIILKQEKNESIYKYCINQIQDIMSIVARNLQSTTLIDRYCEWIFDSIDNICMRPEAMKLILSKSSKTKSLMQSLVNFFDPLSILVGRVSTITNSHQSIPSTTIPDKIIDKYVNFWIAMVMYCFGDNEMCPVTAKPFLSKIASYTPALLPKSSIRSQILNNLLVSSTNLEEKSFYMKSVLKENLYFIGEPPNFFYRLRPYHLVYVHMVYMTTHFVINSFDYLFPVAFYYLESLKLQNEKIYLWNALQYVVEASFVHMVNSLSSEIRDSKPVHDYLRHVLPYIIIKLNNNVKSAQRITEKFIHVTYTKFPLLLCDKFLVRIMMDFLLELYIVDCEEKSTLISKEIPVKGTHFNFLTKPIHHERHEVFLEFQSLILDLIVQGIELSYATMLNIFKDYAFENKNYTSTSLKTTGYVLNYIIKMLSTFLKNDTSICRNESAFSVQSSVLVLNSPAIVVQQDDLNNTNRKMNLRSEKYQLLDRFLTDLNHIILLHSSILEKVEYNKLLNIPIQSYKKTMIDSLKHSWSNVDPWGDNFVHLIDLTSGVFVKYKEFDRELVEYFCMTSVRFPHPKSFKNVTTAWTWVLNECSTFETIFLGYLINMFKYSIKNNQGIFCQKTIETDPFLIVKHELSISNKFENELEFHDMLIDYMCFLVDNWLSVSFHNLAHTFVTIADIFAEFMVSRYKFMANAHIQSISHHVHLRCVLLLMKVSKLVVTLYEQNHMQVKKFKLKIYQICLKIVCDKIGLAHDNYIRQHRDILLLIWDTLTTDGIDLTTSGNLVDMVTPENINAQSNITVSETGAISKDSIFKSKNLRKISKKEKQQARELTPNELRSPTYVLTVANIMQEVQNIRITIDICLSHTKIVLLHLIHNYMDMLNAWDFHPNCNNNILNSGNVIASNYNRSGQLSSSTMYTSNIDYYKSKIIDHSKNDYIRPSMDRQWNIHIKVINKIYPDALVVIKQQFKSVIMVDKIVDCLIYSNPFQFIDCPKALPLFMNSHSFLYVHSYLPIALIWKKPTFIFSLQLLASDTLPRSAIFSQVAANIIEKTHMDTIIFYIPQLVQILRNDIWSVMENLVYKLSSHTQLINHQFLWNIRANIYTDCDGLIKDPTFGDRLEQILERMNRSISQQGYDFSQREFDFFNKITSISGILKPYDKSKRRDICKQELLKIEPSIGVYLPTNPDSIVINIDYESGIPLQSAAKAPFLATFHVLELSCEEVESINLSFDYNEKFLNLLSEHKPISKSAIFKVGDDVRQDVLALQFMAIFKNIYKSLGLNLFLLPYKVVATGPGSGVIECIPNAQSRDQLGKQTEVSLHTYFLTLYGNESTIEYQQARLNFIESMAAYSILTYLLQVKDRHNGNIMINKDGFIIHIDFGFIFDSSPGGNLKFEPNMKITEEMLNIMGGNTESPIFKYFLQECIRAFLALRPYADYFTYIVSHMLNSNLPCFRGDTIKRFRARFNPDVSESEAITFITKIVSDSVLNYRTKLYDILQYAQNEIPY